MSVRFARVLIAGFKRTVFINIYHKYRHFLCIVQANKYVIRFLLIMCFVLLCKTPGILCQNIKQKTIGHEVTVTLKLIQVFVSDNSGSPVKNLKKRGLYIQRLQNLGCNSDDSGGICGIDWKYALACSYCCQLKIEERFNPSKTQRRLNSNRSHSIDTCGLRCSFKVSST